MTDSTKIVSNSNVRPWYVPALLLLSLILLVFGIFLPVISFKELIFFKHDFSVWTGIVSMFEEKHYFLALVIFFFSILFPLVKLGVLGSLWFFKFTPDRREWYLSKLEMLGRWSMLDVFVVAVMIVITKLAHTASAAPKIGIYFFSASILLAMLLTAHIQQLFGKH